MAKRLFTLGLGGAGLLIPAGTFAITQHDDPSTAASAQPVNAVIEWNRTLLSIVRTPGAQSPTIHSTRNFAMLHAAIFEAVNNIDREFEPYAIVTARSREGVPLRRRPTRQLMMFSSRSTPPSPRRSILSSNRTYSRFRMGATRLRASRRVKRLRPGSSRCEATTDQP